MSSAERIAIVGGGVIGLAIAFELARRGARRVSVFDAGPEVVGRATQASAGMLAPYTEAKGGGPLFDLTVRGLQAYAPFVATVREASDTPFEFRQSGSLEVALDDERCEDLQSRLAETSAAASFEWIDCERLRRAAPTVTRAALGALWCPAHGFIAVRALVDALRDACGRLGVQMDLGVRVERISVDATGVIVHTRELHRSFDRIVLSAGAWSPALDPLGELAGRISPLRGQLVRLRVPERPFAQIVWSDDCYLVPWEDGTVLVGATSEHVGYEVRATSDGVRSLLNAACTIVPTLADATFVDVLVGLRPAADAVPILGPARDARVIYAAGHHRNGVLLAPLTGKLIADYIFTNVADPSFVRT